MTREKKLTKNRRLTVEVDGRLRRLGWVAKNRPEILLSLICSGCERRQAMFSALAQAGHNRDQLCQMIEKHPEWEIDLGVFIQM